MGEVQAEVQGEIQEADAELQQVEKTYQAMDKKDRHHVSKNTVQLVERARRNKDRRERELIYEGKKRVRDAVQKVVQEVRAQFDEEEARRERELYFTNVSLHNMERYVQGYGSRGSTSGNLRTSKSFSVQNQMSLATKLENGHLSMDDVFGDTTGRASRVSSAAGGTRRSDTEGPGLSLMKMQQDRERRDEEELFLDTLAKIRE